MRMALTQLNNLHYLTLLQSKIFAVYISLISVILCPTLVSAYIGIFEDYTEVPHSLIQTNETEIYLGNNKLSILNKGEFSNYTALTLLWVYDNSINEIHEEALLGTKIETLSLHTNDLEEFPNVTTISNTLQVLDLGNNRIQNLPSDLLMPLVMLVDLILFKNQISMIQPKMFIGNAELINLDLIANEISVVSFDAFEELPHLISLSLADNNISVFPAKSLENCIALDYLDLGQNPLTAWPNLSVITRNREVGKFLADKVEEHVSAPFHVALSVCRIHTVSISGAPNGELPWFDCPVNGTIIYSLRLTDRKLNDSTDFSRMQSVSPSGNLEDLNLSDNLFMQFPNIPVEIREGLKKLNINNCRIQNIHPVDLEGYNKLHNLDLSNNQLVTLPATLFADIITLDLSDMPSLDFNGSVWQEYLCEVSDGRLRTLYLDRSMDRIQQFPDISHLVCSSQMNLVIRLEQANCLKFIRNIL